MKKKIKNRKNGWYSNKYSLPVCEENDFIGFSSFTYNTIANALPSPPTADREYHRIKKKRVRERFITLKSENEEWYENETPTSVFWK